jgi:mono/diheme cytochrome c family protein
MFPSLGRCALLLAATISIFAFSASASCAEVADDTALRAFATKHCFACHGADQQESELRLDTLAPTIADGETAAAWARVLERVESGEMPPADRPQPTPEELRDVTATLRARLQEARRQRLWNVAGRGARRLNRAEYQNSVNELLGTDLDLAKYLPEDGSIGGFDKVGKGLSISPVLVERYLEAADAALRFALADSPKMPTTTKRYTLWDCGTARRTFTRNGIFAEREDAVVVWYTNDKFFYIEPFTAPVRGKYRIRMSAYACGIKDHREPVDRPVQLALHGGHFRPTGRKAHLIDFFDMKWEQPEVYEAVDLLDEGDTFKITIAGRPPKTFNLLEFAGPALAVQWVDIEGPLDDGAAERRRKLLYADVDPARGTPADADKLLERFIRRAFRRPVTEADLKPYLTVMRQQFALGANFRTSLAVGMQTVLCAPEFLFLDERPEIDDDAIASRLSYFLWSSPPDAVLRTLAEEQKLRDPQVRREQVERMLSDPKGQDFTRRFLDGWLDLKKIDFTTPDRDLYPEFDEPLRQAMLQETRLFFDELLRHDLSVTNVVDSDFAMVNERLARHYGLDGVRGHAFRKVRLPAGSVRGGLLTQAAVLKVTADGTVTSPVLRGVWLLDKILGRPVPPPPPGVPGVEPDIRGATTMREQLAKHRQQASCASCHAKIDPPGFALEGFDPIGGVRERYRVMKPGEPPIRVGGEPVKYTLGTPVDAGDVMPDGRRFADVVEFKRLLLAEPRGLAENFVQKLLIYALGREPDLFDREALREVVARAEPGGYGLRSLLKELVADDVFASR